MQGIGSCPPPEPDDGNNNSGSVAPSVEAAVSSVLSFVKSAANKTSEMINDPNLQENIKGSLDAVKNNEVVKNSI